MDGRKAAALLLAAGLASACSPQDVVSALQGGSGAPAERPPLREVFRDGDRYQFFVAPGAPVDDHGFMGAAKGIRRMQAISVYDAENPGTTLSAMVVRFGRRGAGAYWKRTRRDDVDLVDVAGTPVAIERRAPVPTAWIRYRKDVIVMVAGMPPATIDAVEDLARHMLGGA